MKISRARFLRVGIGASAAWLARTPDASAQDDGRTSRVARLIEEYDAQGIHRTATAVDARSAEWLAGRATQAGAGAVLIEPFPIDRVDIRAAFVEAEGRRGEGVPLFDGAFTDARGVTGRVAPPEYGHPVALVVLDTAGVSSEGRALDALRRSTTHRAVLAVTDGAHPGLSPTNAQAFRKPYGLPVLQISTEDHLWLRDLTARGVEVRVVADAVRTPAQAANVVARIDGRAPDLEPVVLMTPRSGWWHCAAERGGGIAGWIEALGAVAAARPARTVIAVASSGHELGHYGLETFLETRRALVRGAAAWIHLGANIGARGGVPRLQASDDRLAALADAALARAGAEVRQRVPRGTRPGGEARNIHDGGGRYVSLLGSSPFFHNLADRWPAAVDLPAATRFSRAIADLALTLANDRSPGG